MSDSPPNRDPIAVTAAERRAESGGINPERYDDWREAKRRRLEWFGEMIQRAEGEPALQAVGRMLASIPVPIYQFIGEEAAKRGRWCGECGFDFAPGETVWRQHCVVEEEDRLRYVFAPLCETCRLREWVPGGRWERRPTYLAPSQRFGLCGGCRRPTWTVLARGRIVCCRACAVTASRVGEVSAICEACGEYFIASRSDARFCSGRCRVAAHRQRHHS